MIGGFSPGPMIPFGGDMRRQDRRMQQQPQMQQQAQPTIPRKLVMEALMKQQQPGPGMYNSYNSLGHLMNPLARLPGSR